MKVCPVAARWIATIANSTALSTRTRFRNSRNGTNCTATMLPSSRFMTSTIAPGRAAIETWKRSAARPWARVNGIAAAGRDGGGDRRQVSEDGEHHLANLSWLLTCAFMFLKTFAASSLPLRNSSSVGCTIRLICGALSVIG